MPRPEHDLPGALRALLAVPVARTSVAEVLATVADRAGAVLGAGNLWPHPLAVEPGLGSLNPYVHAGGRPEHRAAAAALVEHAAVPVANTWLYEEAVRRADNLQIALSSRAVIEQAKGILMGRLRMTADQAFAALGRTSNDGNVKLPDVAQFIVDTAELPR